MTTAGDEYAVGDKLTFAAADFTCTTGPCTTRDVVFEVATVGPEPPPPPPPPPTPPPGGSVADVTADTGGTAAERSADPAKLYVLLLPLVLLVLVLVLLVTLTLVPLVVLLPLMVLLPLVVLLVLLVPRSLPALPAGTL